MKKVTLFLDKTVRNTLVKDAGWSVAYRSALDFFGKVVAYASDPRVLDPGRLASACQGGFNKFVCGCHSESDDVRAMFAEANRVEAYLTFRWNGALTLVLCAYRTGEKKAHRQMDFSFDRHGFPAGAGYGHARSQDPAMLRT